MKIYQVHKSGGEWEDYYDYIVASYLHEENAMKKKEELEEKQNKRIEQSKKCNECCDYYEDVGYEHCDKKCFMKAVDYEGELFCQNNDSAFMHCDIEYYFVTTVGTEDA